MKKVIGIVGPIASGKGTVIKILEEKGFKSYSLSDRIRDEIRSRGIEITRQSLTNTANELRETLGPDVLARRTSELIEKDNPELIGIDAIRNPAEVEFLKQKFGAKIIGLIAPQEKRWEMFQARGTNTAGINTWEEFKKLDDAELNNNNPKGQQVNASLALTDQIVENSGTIEELKEKIEGLINL